jgi:peptide-methionine (S)-S-oxide reductase
MLRRVPLQFSGLIAVVLFVVSLFGFRQAGTSPPQSVRLAPLPVPGAGQRVATFAGGCFWSMQKAFDGVTGVVSTTAGYSGGTVAKPNYEDVETGSTGHAESVQLIYDPTRISYEQLLDIYWHHTDPLTPNAAFCDHGPQYRSIIFYRDGEQQRLAEASKRALDQSHRFPTPIVTAIQPATAFYPAEQYHQQFYKKNPVRYEAYRIGCGRDERIRELWGEVASRESGVRSQESGVRR